MLGWRSGPAAGLVAQVSLLVALGTTVGVSAFGWVVGLACGVAVNVWVARGLVRAGVDALGPADLVTLTRAVLACAAAALTADAFVGGSATTTLVALAVAALVLDAVDGVVARRTRTESPFGARFDGEVDAFLILVLSVYVARSFGWWVLAIGAVRYVFGSSGWALPWMRRALPPRYWRKVVAAVQGIVLTVAAAEVVPRPLVYLALVIAMALLAESFGRDVWWLWRRRAGELARTEPPVVPGQGARRRSAVTVTLLNVTAFLLVWFALVAPDRTYLLTPGAFLRIPLEGLVLVALALALPVRPRRVLAGVVGVLLGLLTVVKFLDMGFFEAFDRPFNPVTDRGYFDPAVDLIEDSVGSFGATAAVVAAVALVVALLVLMPLAVGRLSGIVARHRGWSARAVAVLALAWVVLAVSGLQAGPGEPVASMSAGRLFVDQVRATASGARDQQRFDAAVAVDRFRDVAGDDLLSGLRGKDVLVTFVESYGRIAIEGSPSSLKVQALLEEGTSRLRASGYATRSAFLTSPTFGGLSWLAHSTLQSGVWVDNQARYDRLLSGNRLTLSRAFGRAGWRTLAVLPADKSAWPEGKAFYGFDKVFGRRGFGYAGPRFGFSKMPDQFALWAFQRLELAKRPRPPVMAEIDLASSHAPWAPQPEMVDWSRLGDGSIFERIHERADPATDLFGHPHAIEAAYVKSIAYTLEALIAFIERYGDDDLVMVVLGDHQPAAVVTGHGASHDVPVTVIAHDPAVLDRISDWGWQEGMRPGPGAPVWPMDAFRDRFLEAFSAPGSRAQTPPQVSPPSSAPRP